MGICRGLVRRRRGEEQEGRAKRRKARLQMYDEGKEGR
jgi:hypothetical protein